MAKQFIFNLFEDYLQGLPYLSTAEYESAAKW